MNECKLIIQCPVCGREQIEGDNVACRQCSFQFAYITYFAGEKSVLLWQQKVKDHKLNYEKQQNVEANNKLILGRDSIGFISRKNNELQIIYGDGRKPFIEKNVMTYVTGDNNYAILSVDGTVKVFGDNTYGQCNVAEYKELSDISISNTCTYLVRKDGRVNLAGAVDENARKGIENWKDILSISASDQMVIGLTKSGTIQVESLSDRNTSSVSKISGWKDVKKVKVHGTRCIALFEDGTVKTSWEDEHTTEIEKWNGITDIACDDSFVLGLTSQKGVLLAGKARNKLFDAGRSEAVSWNNIVAISVSNYTIGGCDTEGNLHIAGKMGGKRDEFIKEWASLLNH